MERNEKVDSLQEVAWTYDPVRKEIRSETTLSPADAREDARVINGELQAQFGEMAGPQGMFATADKHTVVVKNVTPEEFSDATGAQVSNASRRGAHYG